MNRQIKQMLTSISTAIFIFLGIVIWLDSFSDNWMMFFVIFIIASTFPSIVFSIIPTKEKKTPKKTSKKTSTHKKQASSTSKRKKLTDNELLTADIDSLLGEEFERLVYLYFKDRGFKPETTPKTGDHGVDLVIIDPKDGLKIAVQCKRYKSGNGIGNADLIKLEGGKRFYKCPGTLFITTSHFTDKAREYALSVRMETWNGLQVMDNIGKWRKQKLMKSS